MNARINERTFLQVETNSLYLKEEFGDMSFWPNESGRFNVLHLDDGHPLQVMGEDLQTSSNAPQIAEQHSGQVSQVFTYGGTPGSSSRPALFGGNKRKGGAIVKIIHAEMTHKNEKGPPSFQELGQTYINISEDTANVHYVLSKARDAFNDPCLELVTSNGLKIMNNEGTKGHF